MLQVGFLQSFNKRTNKGTSLCMYTYMINYVINGTTVSDKVCH